MALRRQTAGQAFDPSASTWNAFCAATEEVIASQMDAGSGRNSSRKSSQNTVIWIRNDSGDDLDQFNILGLETPLVTPDDNLDEFKGHPALSGDTPDKDKHIGKFAILLEPIPAGEFGRACISGLCVVQIEVSSNEEWYDYADIKDDEATKLKGAPHGAAQVLWKETGTGTKWALVRMGTPQGQTCYWGKLDGSLSSGSSATVSIYWKDPLVDSNNNVTAYAPPLLKTGSLDSGKWVEVVYRPDAQKWYVRLAEC
jgi:hypothetical protein